MNVGVYQIQYGVDVVGEFDPVFLRYDCCDNPESEKREMAHMLRFYRDKPWSGMGFRYFGLVSPKFNSKTGFSGKEFIGWVEDNPGYDVYMINPFPQLSYFNFNVWEQGESWHPGLCDLADSLFEAAGYDVRVSHLGRNSIATSLYSNYWVGSEVFWARFMSFVENLDSAVVNLPIDKLSKIFSSAPHYAPALYYPFVFERLFSTFLLLCKDVSCCCFEYSNEQIANKCQNEMERYIVREWGGVIDAWDKAGWDDAEYRKIFKLIGGILGVYVHKKTVDLNQDIVSSDGGLFRELRRLFWR